MIRTITLLAATTAIGMVPATQAFADNVYGPATLRGSGASGVAPVVTQAMNCFGGPNNPVGYGNGTWYSLPDHVYTPVKPGTINPNYDCATMSIQDAVEGQYVSTGSTAGKTNWKNFTATKGITTNPFGTWNRIHYAWSQSPVTPSDLTNYYINAGPTAGNAIQIPMMIVPVGFSYMPVYGKVMRPGGVVEELTLNIAYPRTTANLGGLRMKKTTYCGIVNGTITNWNDPALKADNGGQSLMDPDDDVYRWNYTGVPIKLVGRSDASGTTNLFTRAMTAQCGDKFTAGGTDLLPAATHNPWFPNRQAIYNKNTGALTSGFEIAGLFGLADGDDGVAAAVSQEIPDPLAVGDVTLGGYLGYNSASWLAPTVLANGKMLHSAQLQQGTTTKFRSPTAADATLAFQGIQGILPPQSDSRGKYYPANTSLGMRNDPLAWVVPATTVTAGSLANPSSGYPIVGTANILLYTCYADANVRNALQGYLSLLLGQVKIPDNQLDGAPSKVPAMLITSMAKDAVGNRIGLFGRHGIAPMPKPWTTAINETFLTNTRAGNIPGALNLWIQDELQDYTGDTTAGNPACTPGVGA